MPVTLCFIKDKHEVMEHKILLETYFAGLLQKVEWQIQEYEDTAADTLTLCRLCGVPAQWQSGLYTKPDSAGHHDWARFYVAPFGWLFADCSFGGSAYRAGDLDRWNFYFGNLEPWRMPTCSAFQQEFNPPRRFLRYDPYDNQSGDVESLTRRLYADEYEHDCRVLRYEEME